MNCKEGFLVDGTANVELFGVWKAIHYRFRRKNTVLPRSGVADNTVGCKSTRSVASDTPGTNQNENTWLRRSPCV